MSPHSRETLGLILGLIGVIIFGVTLPLTRIAVVSLDPWFVTFGRAALAGCVAIPVLLFMRKSFPSPHEAFRLLLAAMFVIIGFPGFTGFAMQLVPASHGGVVLGILPLVVAIFGSLAARERPSMGFWASAVIGAVLVIAFSLRDEDGGLGWGDLYLLGAALSAASGYTILAHAAKSKPGWEVISWTVVLFLPVTIPLAFLTAPHDFAVVPTAHWFAFLYLGLMSQYVGFFFWNTGLAMGGQARVSQTQLLQTFVTLICAAAINHEPVDLLTWIFAVAIVAVVLIGRRARIAKSL